MHGHLPWWNYYEGLGQPLAGEMQAASFFPLTLWFALPAGLLWFHISLEVIAGFSAYFLAKRLGVPMIFATAAGLSLRAERHLRLGRQRGAESHRLLADAAARHRDDLRLDPDQEQPGLVPRRDRHRARLLRRLPRGRVLQRTLRPRLGRRAALLAAARLAPQAPSDASASPAASGILLSLPILVPFADFSKVANLGHHTAAIDGTAHISIHAIQMFFDPYVHGTLFTNPNVASVWGGIGGYFTASVGALALLGLFG